MPLTQKIAEYIVNVKVGCRFGTTTQGAAYAFLDIVGEGQDGSDPGPSTGDLLQFIFDPNQARFEPRWDNRLWNTCGVIVGLGTSGTVIIVSQAPGTAERYLFNSAQAKGDRYSFRKINQLPSSSEILKVITYGKGNTAPEVEPGSPAPGSEVSIATVEELNGKIVEALSELAPG